MAATKAKWELYGCEPCLPAFVTNDGPGEQRSVWMWRRAAGQRVQFRLLDGSDIGPEHGNVYPATVWAFAQGWFDPQDLVLSACAIAEVRANSRQRGTSGEPGAWDPIEDDRGTVKAPTPPASADGDRGDIPAPLPSVVPEHAGAMS